MGAIFVSYRRGDSEGQVTALVQTLARHVPKKFVFKDVDTIRPGRDFRQALDEYLASCDMMLVIIGKGWLSATNAAGKRRLDDPEDFVRREVAAALKRNIPVIPVLVQGASIPSADDLPDDLQDLAYRNSFELGHNKWDSDVNELIRRLGLNKSRAGYWVGGVAVAAILVALAVVALQQQSRQKTVTSEPPIQSTSTTTTVQFVRPMGPLEEGINRGGNDIFPNPIIAKTAAECSDLCGRNASCEAMTFTPRAEEKFVNGNCWLKTSPGQPSGVTGYFSAVKQATP